MKRVLCLFLFGLCFFLALALVLACPAWAAETDFALEDGVLVAYTGPGGEVVIPEGVTAIGDYVFEDRTDIQKVTIPGSVTSIGDGAFAGCTSLTSIRVPGRVTQLGAGVFRRCVALQKAAIVGPITRLERYTFADCRALSQLELPETVAYIGEVCFAGCASLPAFTVWAHVEEIGYGAFTECTGLKQVTFFGNTQVKDNAFDGCTGLETVHCPKTMTDFGENAFGGTAFLDALGRWPVLNGVLLSCGPDVVVGAVPDGVTKIAPGAFVRSPYLTQVTLPETVAEIGDYAFAGCDNLRHVVVLGQPVWGEDVFDRCENVTLHGGGETYAGENGLAYSPDTSLPQEETWMAYVSTQTVTVDDETMEFEMYALKNYRGYETNYIRVRDLASAMASTPGKFNVVWDGNASLYPGQDYDVSETNPVPFTGDTWPCRRPNTHTLVNGETATADAILLQDDNGGGYIYYKLRDLGKILGFNVDWSGSRGVYIETDKPYQG